MYKYKVAGVCINYLYLITQNWHLLIYLLADSLAMRKLHNSRWLDMSSPHNKSLRYFFLLMIGSSKIISHPTSFFQLEEVWTSYIQLYISQVFRPQKHVKQTKKWSTWETWKVPYWSVQFKAMQRGLLDSEPF